MWISAYIYQSDPLEELLVNGVNTFIGDLTDKKIAHGYFFIRYWTKGKHIRLRIQVDRENSKLVKKLLISHFSNYFVTHPIKDLSHKEGLYNPSTIRFVAYKPEVTRYGGPQGILIAENQFMLSSETALTIMSNRNSQSEKQPENTLFSYALQMNFIMFYISANIPTLRKIFNHQENWGTENNETFEKTFNKQKNNLFLYFNKLTNEMIFNTEAPGWMKHWKFEMAQVSEDLQRLVHQNAINSEKYIEVLFTYMHMNNNRLGLIKYEELYLNFLLNKLYCFLE